MPQRLLLHILAIVQALRARLRKNFHNGRDQLPPNNLLKRSLRL